MSVHTEELRALELRIGDASHQLLLVVTSQLHPRVLISRHTRLSKLLSRRHEDLLPLRRTTFGLIFSSRMSNQTR
jgi:hypothetical protein